MTRKQRIYEIAGMIISGEMHSMCFDQIDLSGLTLMDAQIILDAIQRVVRLNTKLSKQFSELAEVEIPSNRTNDGKWWIDIPKELDSKSKRDNYSA